MHAFSPEPHCSKMTSSLSLVFDKSNFSQKLCIQDSLRHSDSYHNTSSLKEPTGCSIITSREPKEEETELVPLFRESLLKFISYTSLATKPQFTLPVKGLDIFAHCFYNSSYLSRIGRGSYCPINVTFASYNHEKVDK